MCTFLLRITSFYVSDAPFRKVSFSVNEYQVNGPNHTSAIFRSFGLKQNYAQNRNRIWNIRSKLCTHSIIQMKHSNNSKKITDCLSKISSSPEWNFDIAKWNFRKVTKKLMVFGHLPFQYVTNRNSFVNKLRNHKKP